MFFHWMGRQIPAYGVMIALGIFAGSVVGALLVRKNHLSYDDMILGAVFTMVGGFLGAKLLYLWVMRDAIDWTRILEREYFQVVMSGGFVFYGGVFGGILALYLAGRWYKFDAWTYLFLCIPTLPLMHAFGRIGCGLAGCCYGIPYDGIFHVVYHAPSAGPVEIPLFPVQFLEAGINFLTAAFLFAVVWRRGASPKNLIWYFIPYSISRFFLEYLRYDTAERGMWLGFSTSQWISMGLLAVSVLLLKGPRPVRSFLSLDK